MAQAATPGGPRLPCSSKQALTLYQVLFRRPVGLGQLRTALQQVHEGGACSPGLELPMVLLEMERSQRAQEKLLWDLELLTGMGLGLFWPPWTRICGQRAWAQCAWSHHNQPSGGIDGDSEKLVNGNSKLHLLPQTQEAPSDSHQLPEGRQAIDSPSALDLSEARSDVDLRLEGPHIPAEAAPGCLQELNPTISSSFKEPGNSKLKDLAQGEERSKAEPTIQSSHGSTSRSPQGRKLTQGVREPTDFASRGLPAQDSSKSSGQSRGKAKPETLLAPDSPQGRGEKPARDQSEQTPQGCKGDTPQGKDKGAPHRQKALPQCGRKQVPPGGKMKSPQFGKGSTREVWGTTREEDTVWYQEEGNPQDYPRDVYGSSSAAGTTLGTSREEGWTPRPARMPAEGGMLAHRLQGLPAPSSGGRPSPTRPEVGGARRPGGLPGQVPGDSKPSEPAWPVPRGPEEARASAEQRETALQRLLELHSAARRRRRRDREQQRLRILERLRMVGNRDRRVHPLPIPPSAAHLPPQDDAAGWRRALREQLELMQRERTRRLRALRARNTQNFQELLSPGAEESTPGK